MYIKYLAIYQRDEDKGWVLMSLLNDPLNATKLKIMIYVLYVTIYIRRLGFNFRMFYASLL